MPDVNNGSTWLSSLWVIFIFLNLFSVFCSFFSEHEMPLKSEKKGVFKYKINLILPGLH